MDRAIVLTLHSFLENGIYQGHIIGKRATQDARIEGLASTIYYLTEMGSLWSGKGIHQGHIIGKNHSWCT